MAKVPNLVTFVILLGLITLLIYLYYLRKRRTQQTLQWLRSQNVIAQNQFGQTAMIYPYGNHGTPGQNYFYNHGLVFMPMGFSEAAQLRHQNLQASAWARHGDLGDGESPYPNAYNTPHFIAAPPYTPGNYMNESTIEDLPPPYSSVVKNEELKTDPPSLSPEPDKIVAEPTSQNVSTTK